MTKALAELGPDLQAQETEACRSLLRCLEDPAVPSPEFVDGLRMLGQRAAEAGRSALAVELYEYVMPAYPSDASLPYDIGNHLGRLDRPSEAVRAYDRALELDPTLAQAFHNRAIAHARLGDEEACARDLLEAIALEYDQEQFWPTFVNHLGLTFLANFADEETLPARYRNIIAARVGEFLQECGMYLQEYPDQGVTFARSSLAPRAALANMMVRGGDEVHPDIVRVVFSLVTEPGLIGDPEFSWRAKFLAATMLYPAYDTTEWSPTGDGGVFFDIDYLENTLAYVVPPSSLDSLVTELRPGLASESHERRCARFVLELVLASLDGLLELRSAYPPPAGSAGLHWALAQSAFKILMATAAFLEDDDAFERGLELSRRLNVAFSVDGWTGETDDVQVLLGAVLGYHGRSTADRGSRLPAETMLVEHFIYETGGDNLCRRVSTASGSRLEYQYLAPSDVSRLLHVATQWQDPSALGALRGVEGVDEFGLLMNAWSASAEVPAEGYGEWLGELVLGTDLESAEAVSRLVVVPFNYLHNIPYHLIPSVRRLIDAGQLTEVVVATTVNTQTRPSTVWRRERASCLFVGVNSPEVDADGEYEIVSSHFTEMSRLIDAEATPEAIVSGCACHDVVHFACHGDFDPLRNANYLVLPEGRLYPGTLASMTDNRCQLVLMNSCISGIVAREARNGDQALGLSNALLYAGAEEVVATLWQLEPEPAIEFADTFYSLWQEADKTTAAVVLEAQKALRARYPGDVLSWGAHSFFGNWC
jgi:hypothetical protein